MDSFSQRLIHMISILDTYGASEWNTRAIAVTVSNRIFAIYCDIFIAYSFSPLLVSECHIFLGNSKSVS